MIVFQGGNTALHMAVARDQIGTVKIILGYKPLYAVPNNVSIVTDGLIELLGGTQLITFF